MKYLSKSTQDQIDHCFEAEADYILDEVASKLQEGEYASVDEMMSDGLDYLNNDDYYDQSREGGGFSGAVYAIMSLTVGLPECVLTAEVTRRLEDLARSYPWGSGEGEDGGPDVDGGDESGLEPSGDSDS